MRLFHGTDDDGARSIRSDGFARSDVDDSHEQSWFAETRDGAATASRKVRWFVIVNIPDDIAERHRYRFDDGTAYLGNFLIPWRVVNGYQPFTFERATNTG